MKPTPRTSRASPANSKMLLRDMATLHRRMNRDRHDFLGRTFRPVVAGPFPAPRLSAPTRRNCGTPSEPRHHRMATPPRRTPAAAPNGPETAAPELRPAATPPPGPTATPPRDARV